MPSSSISKVVINDNIKVSYLTTSDKFPSHNSEKPQYFYCIGLIVGISRQFDRYDRQHNLKPYNIYATDFCCSVLPPSERKLSGEEFDNDTLNDKIYNFTMFPESFDALAEKVKDRVDLHNNIRMYDYFQRELTYLDQEGNIDRLKHWKQRLDKNGIWCYFRLRTRQYLGITELQCCNSFYVIPLKNLKGELERFKRLDIWNTYKRGYESTHIFDAMELDSDFNIDSDEMSEVTSDKDSDSDFFRSQIMGESSLLGEAHHNTTSDQHSVDVTQEHKRRKLADADDFSILSNKRNILDSSDMNSQSRIVDDSWEAKKYKNMTYSLIHEIKKLKSAYYNPQFIVVERVVIITPKDSYIYLSENRITLTKQIKMKVTDEKGDFLIVYVEGKDLCRFLGIQDIKFAFSDELDADITRIIKSQYVAGTENQGSYGMMVSQWEICDDVWQWKWEHTTANIST